MTTGANVKSLMNSINDLVNLTERISNRWNEIEYQCGEDTAKLFTKIDALTKENTEVKKRVDGLTQQPGATALGGEAGARANRGG